MSWEDRLQEARYQAPSGRTFDFQYEDVKKNTVLNTVAYDFPDADGTYVQQLGSGGRRIPLRIYFSGEDYDMIAQKFDKALLEFGIGILTHPIYGTIDVVPFGNIERIDNLKSAANQAIYNITFFETIGIIYPTSQDSPASDVEQAVEEYTAAAAEDFKDVTSLNTVVEQAQIKGTYQAILDQVDSELQDIAASNEDIEEQFRAIRDSINSSIDTLVSQPLTLAFQSELLMQAPSRAATSIQARLEAYRNLFTSLTLTVFVPNITSEVSNQFHAFDLNASTTLTGSVLSVLNTTFETKTDAISAAEFILEQMDSLIAWRDSNFASLGEIDTGQAYQQLVEAVGLAAGFLVQISFTLKQERVLVLVRPRTIIDLSSELYGTIDDDTLNFMIDSNNLSGDEIKEIQPGRRIVYYV